MMGERNVIFQFWSIYFVLGSHSFIWGTMMRMVRIELTNSLDIFYTRLTRASLFSFIEWCNSSSSLIMNNLQEFRLVVWEWSIISITSDNLLVSNEIICDCCLISSISSSLLFFCSSNSAIHNFQVWEQKRDPCLLLSWLDGLQKICDSVLNAC